MKILHLTFISLILLILISCSSLKVVSDYNGELDYSQYKTYNFHKPDSIPKGIDVPVVMNQLNQRRVEKAIIEEMELRGYIQSENPDIFISYYLKVEEKTEYRATSYNYGSPYYGGYGYYGYYGGYGHTMTDVSSYDYKMGTLIVDLVDAQKNELMWYGAATKALDDHPKNAEATINYVITKIFDRYQFLAGQSEPVKYPPKK